MFNSKSFVKTVALQLFRTSNLFGFLYVAALIKGWAGGLLIINQQRQHREIIIRDFKMPQRRRQRERQRGNRLIQK